MRLPALLGTGWTVWKIASKRVGPLGGVLAAVAVVGGLVYVKPWVKENAPDVAGLLESHG
jgi:hypothetical protein